MLFKIANFLSWARFLFWRQVLRHFGGDIQKGTRIYEGVKMYSAAGSPIVLGENGALQKGVVIAASDYGRISIGKNVYLGEYVILSARQSIEIGDDAILASHTFVVDFNHRFDDPKMKIADQGYDKSPVVIGRDVWIGAGSKIIMGVKIGEGSVIGAGSVVTRDVPPYSICFGSPARVVRSRGPRCAEPVKR